MHNTIHCSYAGCHPELTKSARERTVDTPQQNGTETLSIHVDFTADSSPDSELSTYV